MRNFAENKEVMELAEYHSKPVVGGGDRHTAMSSSILAGIRHGSTLEDFKAEVRDGQGSVIFTEEYFKPFSWRMFIRSLIIVQSYRNIFYYKHRPLTRYQIPERMITDTIANLSGFLRKIVSAF